MTKAHWGSMAAAVLVGSLWASAGLACDGEHKGDKKGEPQPSALCDGEHKGDKKGEPSPSCDGEHKGDKKGEPSPSLS